MTKRNSNNNIFSPLSGSGHYGDVNQGNTVNVGAVTINNFNVNNNNFEVASEHQVFENTANIKVSKINNEEKGSQLIFTEQTGPVKLANVTLCPGASIKNELPQNNINIMNIKAETTNNASSIAFSNIKGAYSLEVRYDLTIYNRQTVIINKGEDGRSPTKLSTLTFEGSGIFENNSGESLKINILKINISNTIKYIADCDNILKVTVYENGSYELVKSELHASENQSCYIFAAGTSNQYYEDF